MAESLVFSLAESFISKLASRAVEETSLALGVYNHLREIKDTVSLIKAVLLDAEQKQRHNHELREWIRQIKHVFSNAEDVIDDFECEALRKRVVNSSGTVTRKVRRFFSSSNPLVYRLKMAHNIKHIKERFDKVASDRVKFGLQINDSDNRLVKRRELTHSHVIDSDVIGRDYDKQKIIDLLLQGDKGVSVIPIVGIGGLGKTTLAKAVFNDKTSVSDSATNLTHKENFRNLDIEQLQHHLRNTVGFLPSPNRGESVEDVSNRILHELWSRSFLQDFVVLGSSCEFKLHDLVHDLALYVAKHEFQLVKFHNENVLENVLHLSFFENDLLGPTPMPTRLRTIVFPIEANNEAFLNTLTSRCKFVRILKLTDSTYESLPGSIGKLKHLRYLNLARNKELKSLPNSICKLQNLITLKLGGCTKLEILPNGIGNLISLRQLWITTKQSNFPNKEISKLANLELLSISSCDNLESLFQGIQLPRLKCLNISLCDNLKSLPLHAIVNLETLLIDNCNKLNLSFDHDNEISNLSLKLLCLDSLPQLVSSIPQWLRGCANTLHTLKIDNCENLYKLHEWSLTLVCLNILVIRNCSKLVSLTDDTCFLPNLEVLGIIGCPELLGRYQPGVGCDWHKISHIKQVYIE
ncbi:hypothetical protein RYX36_018886 [Vicia faba]